MCVTHTIIISQVGRLHMNNSSASGFVFGAYLFSKSPSVERISIQIRGLKQQLENERQKTVVHKNLSQDLDLATQLSKRAANDGSSLS